MCDPDKNITQKVRKVYLPLRYELERIQEAWATYSLLYFAENGNIDLLNKWAPEFFAQCQDAFLSDVILSICRVLDKPQMRGNENLCLKRLVEVAEEDVDQKQGGKDLVAYLNDSLKVIRSVAQPLTAFRHKRLGHNDKKVCLGEEAIPPVAKKNVDDTIAKAGALLTKISAFYRKAPGFSFDYPDKDSAGQELVYSLTHQPKDTE